MNTPSLFLRRLRTLVSAVILFLAGVNAMLWPVAVGLSDWVSLACLVVVMPAFAVAADRYVNRRIP